ncbi:MAG: universal stress protein [Flavobacteriales bacterium]|nr:universal stress protein [Flavobacteriales bacterium]
MKKILVPTDFSDTADKARDYAVQIAQMIDAEIVLLNTYHIPYAGASAGTLVNVDAMALEDSQKNMKEQLEYARLNFSDVKFSTVCSPGLLTDSVKELVKKGGYDLIVMGTTGTSGMIENFLGSNASSLIGAVKTPIITVPAKASLSLPKRIVVANDLTDSGEGQLYSSLKAIAGGNDATIDFLFVVDDEAQASRKIEHLKAAKFDEEFDTSYHPFHFKESHDVEAGILEYLKENEFDLLVVVTHQRNFWEKLVDKSVSKSLVKHAEIPILVLAD